MKKEYKKFYFRLSGYEGAEFIDFKVTNFGTNKKKVSKLSLATRGNVHFIVQVVGLCDEKAPRRNW